MIIENLYDVPKLAFLCHLAVLLFLEKPENLNNPSFVLSGVIEFF